MYMRKIKEVSLSLQSLACGHLFVSVCRWSEIETPLVAIRTIAVWRKGKMIDIPHSSLLQVNRLLKRNSFH